MFNRLWDYFVETMMLLFLPAVSAYHLLTADLFLNVSAADAAGCEKIGNFLLTPLQYLFAGRVAIPQENGSWLFMQRFDYREGFWVKTGASIIAVAPSLILGSALKSLSFLKEQGRSRHASLLTSKSSTTCHSHLDLYKKWGIPLGNPEKATRLISQGCERRPGDEHFLGTAKTGLVQIITLLNEAKIPWWADCGTCLGAYRYGGVIPWDDDIDIAILVTDFENTRRVLNQLDSKRFHVQDWSSRSFPNTFFKVYMKESGDMIDIFCFRIDIEKKEIASIFSLDEAIFFPEWFKIRERRFSVPTSFDTVFPLKKALFDGIEVFVPNQTKEYLQRYYGENLDPVKIYDPKTNRYERDLSHPYWQKSYVH